MSLLLCMMLAAHSTDAQTASTDVRLVLTIPRATCTLVLQEDVDFGAMRSTEQTALLSPNGTWKRGQTPGRFVLTGKHASDYMISIDFPSQITGPGAPLAYEGQWGHAKTDTAPFEVIAGKTLHLPARGAFTRHFRVWGRIQGLSIHTTPGRYAGKISISTTCT